MPTSWVTSQEADITWHALETAYLLLWECWSNNFANSHPSPGPFNRRVLCSCMVLQWACPPYQRRLANCDWTRCLRPTSADNLSILAGTQPGELHCNEATLSLARRAVEPGHRLHSALTCPSSADARHLKLRHPFIPATQQLISLSDNNIYMAQWVDHQWNAEWADNLTRLRIFIPDSGTHPPPWMTFPRTAWVQLYCLRTGVRHFHVSLSFLQTRTRDELAPLQNLEERGLPQSHLLLVTQKHEATQEFEARRLPLP